MPPRETRILVVCLLWSLCMGYYFFGLLLPTAHRGAVARGHLALARACAGAALYRRDVVLALGGFDERYFLFSEDLDLSRRYRARDFELRTTDALAGIHVGGGSSSAVVFLMRIFAFGASCRKLAITFGST